MEPTGASLEAISGEMAGKKFDLGEGETTIGRGPENDILVRDPTASRNHAVIRGFADNYTLVDLGSTSGTRLNGKRIQSTRLEDGDTVTIGETNFIFQRQVDIESAATVMAEEDSIPTMLDPPAAAAAAAAAKPPPGAPAVPPLAAAAAPRATPPPAPPAVPPPASPRIGDAGVITEDGVLEQLPMKWIGVGCAVMFVIGLCILGAVLGAQLLSADEDEPAPVVYQTATLPPEPIALPTEAAEEPTSPPPPTSEGGEPTIVPTPEGTQGPGGPIIGGGTGEIAFASDVNGVPQIFLVGIDGIEYRQLTDLQDGACQPTWAPDGMRMAFISPCGDNRSEYPGSSLYMITFDTSGEILGPSPLPSVLGGGDFDPEWSPEGERLVFTTLRTSRPQIFRMNLDGTGLQRLTTELTYNWEPTWSPDGGKVAFMTTRQTVDEVWTVFSEGGSESRFTLGDSKAAAHPDWSPDGSTILFEKVVGAIPRLMGAPVADGGVREVLVCQSGDLAVQPMSEPAWSPDGQWMAFETWPDGENHDIAIISNNCSNYQEISTASSEEFDAAWRPAP